MVFHHRKNHLIPLLHEFLTEAGDKQVDTLRRTTGEDNLIRTVGIDETSHRLTRGLVQLCSLLRQEVHSAMHIGIHRIIFVRNGIHYLPRFLRSGTVVQVDQWFAIYLTGKDGEISPEPLPQPLPRREGSQDTTLIYIVVHNESKL